MKELQVLGMMLAVLVAGGSVAEEDQGGLAPRKNVSAGAIWHEKIKGDRPLGRILGRGDLA